MNTRPSRLRASTRGLVAFALLLSVLLPVAATAAPTPSILAGPCAAGATYDPACDVDHDGDVDVLDVQLAAGHWNQSGMWTGGDGWSLNGNAGTVPGVNVLGTTDGVSLTVVVSGTPALRIVPATISPGILRPNLIGGAASNTVPAGVFAATVGGGAGNAASSGYATVGGGYANTASDNYATVGGGYANTASGDRATVAGGHLNTASGYRATVAGGNSNTASGPYSFAAGRRAKATHDGAFVWADATNADFTSDLANTFNVRASNGARVVANHDGNGLAVYNNGTNGVGIYAEGSGSGKTKATLRANNTEASGGIAAYLTNDSTFANVHAYNGGSGEVLWLQNGGTDAAGTGGGDFIRAVNDPGTDTQFRVSTSGEVFSDVGYNSASADIAELLPAVAGLEPGDVLAVGTDGLLVRSTEAYQSTVMGVYSTRPGFVGGMPVDGESTGKVPLAVVGIVPVKASAEGGAIQPGDLLAASSTPGHAMRCQGAEQCFGRTIGKALEPLAGDTGMILMLVILQ